MEIGPKIDAVLKAELAAGNAIEGCYEKAFAKCKILVILKQPFAATRDGAELVEGLESFINRDSHYPIGKGYIDHIHSSIILAPLA